MTSIGIVCGYDLNGDLPVYVDGVARALAGEHCDVVIVSGGPTSPLTAHSEAWRIAEGIQAMMPDLEIVLEERALTTLDNLVFAKGIACHTFDAIDRYVVFCDSAHAFKVRLLSRMILGPKATVLALHRNVPLSVRLIEPFSIVLEALGALSPNLRHLVRAGAVWTKGLSEERRRSVLRAAASTVSLPSHPERRARELGARAAP
jgi:hypothetical protein